MLFDDMGIAFLSPEQLQPRPEIGPGLAWGRGVVTVLSATSLAVSLSLFVDTGLGTASAVASHLLVQGVALP